MRALRFHKAHELCVEKVPEPGSPGPGEVLLKPLMCGICGTDLHEYTDGPIVTPAAPHPLTGAELPQILGHEFAAVVAEAGPGVTHVRDGDLCTVMPLIACGRCHECVRGRGHLCRTMACTGLSSAWGGLADLAIVSAPQVVPVAEAMTAQQAALIEPTAVAAYGIDQDRLARRSWSPEPGRSARSPRCTRWPPGPPRWWYRSLIRPGGSGPADWAKASARWSWPTRSPSRWPRSSPGSPTGSGLTWRLSARATKAR